MERTKRVELRIPLMFRLGVVCPEDQDPLAWLKDYVGHKQPRLEFEWAFKNGLAIGRLDSLEFEKAVVLSKELEEEKGD